MTNSGKGILLSITVHAVIVACAVLISRTIRSSIQAAQENQPIEIEVFEETLAAESGGQSPRIRRDGECLPDPEKAAESTRESLPAVEEEAKQPLEEVREQVEPAPEPEVRKPIEGPVPKPAQPEAAEEETGERKMEVGVSLEADHGDDRETVSAVVVQEVKQAVPVAVIRPKYPPSARRRGIEGDVALEAEVDAAGNVTAVAILQSSGNKVLDDAAVEAMRKAKFQAAEENGKKVPAVVRQTLSFRLK